MAKRRQKNLEIERKVQQRKLVFRVVTLVVALIIVTATAIGIWTVQDRRWILKYDGGRVATTDFRAVMDRLFENNPAARSAGMTTLQGVIVILDRADAHGVGLTPEERAPIEIDEREGREQVQAQFGWDPFDYISVSRVVELLNTGPVVERLLDIYVPTYDLDESEFIEMWEEYQETSLHDFWDVQVNFIALETEEEIQEVYDALDTAPFEDLMRQFTAWMDDETEIIPMDLTNDPETGHGGLLSGLQQMWLSPEDEEALLALQEGETSGIIELFDFDIGQPIYVIINVVSRDDDVDLDEAEGILRNMAIMEGRQEVFHELVLSWVEDANFRVNQRGYNTV